MRISSEEYKGLRDRVYEIIENETWWSGDTQGGLIEGVDEAVSEIMKKVVDQLVKIKEITY